MRSVIKGEWTWETKGVGRIEKNNVKKEVRAQGNKNKYEKQNFSDKAEKLNKKLGGVK
jgi:hypothetical protein